ncbi:hypothetical protein [Aquitalea magnusonii]|uniref:hypothetical protein n=1 Tax=Aquitalea magnusonii TaxID=332411 RepID=UPI0011B45BE0|nr:hypothetical protein [Aquitalea magnusonii]
MNQLLPALNHHVGKVQRIGIFCLILGFLRFYAAGAHEENGWDGSAIDQLERLSAETASVCGRGE